MSTDDPRACNNPNHCQHNCLPYEYKPYEAVSPRAYFPSEGIVYGTGQRLSAMICSECGEVKKVEKKK